MRRLARGVLALSVLAICAALLLVGVNQLAHAARPAPDLTPRIGLPLLGAVFAVTGGALGVRRQSAVIGWLFAAVGVALSFGSLFFEYGVRGVFVAPGSLPGADIGIWVGDWLPFVMIPAVPILLLVFPTGRVLSPRWRIPMTIALIQAPLFLLQDMFSSSHLPGALRHGAGGAVGAFFESDPVTMVGNLFALVAFLSALASLGLRIRRGESVERHQLKWFAYAAGLVVVALLASGASGLAGHSIVLTVIFDVIFFGAFASVPASVGIAVLKYRLYDIDLVISRTLVYGAMGAFITAVYVGIVVGTGTLLGSGQQPNLLLSILATAIVAVAFQPVRERLQKAANRLVYGKRATPYEVLSEFSARVAESYTGADVLPRMARVLAEGTGAVEATVWLRALDRLHPAATHPAGANGHAPLDLVGQRLPVVPGADRAVPVHHQGELLGALAIKTRAGVSLTPIEEKLLDDLAGQAGLVLKNLGLAADLQARLAELQASRQRLVRAQDDERRKLERNLHDGAQQSLVALKVKLGLAEQLAGKDPVRAQAMVSQLKDDADQALETLRDLARGIYPPLLADRGLTSALESQARKASVPIAVHSEGIERYPQEVEAAVYFCCLEALQNVQKYAAAQTVTVRLEGSPDWLRFSILDDGAGFDANTVKMGAGLQNMTDRLAALGGTLEITSAPAQGTRVDGRLPVSAAPSPVQA